MTVINAKERGREGRGKGREKGEKRERNRTGKRGDRGKVWGGAERNKEEGMGEEKRIETKK